MLIDIDGYVILFRRFVRRNGRLLDAWHYGHRAWRIRIPPWKYRPPAQMELNF